MKKKQKKKLKNTKYISLMYTLNLRLHTWDWQARFLFFSFCVALKRAVDLWLAYLKRLAWVMERVEGLECRFFPLRPMHSLYVRVLALLSTKLHAAVAAGNGWLRRRRFRPKARLMTLVPIQRSIAPIACTTMHGGTDASLNLLSCVTFSQPESLNLACSCFIEYLSNVSLLVN